MCFSSCSLCPHCRPVADVGSRSGPFRHRRADAVAAALQPGTAGRRPAALAVARRRAAPLLLGLQWMIGCWTTAASQRHSGSPHRALRPGRATLWRAALDIFSDHPLLGAGFDSFSRLFFLRIESYPINGVGIPEHSHNLLTEFAAEFGLAGLALIGTGGFLAGAACASASTTQRCWRAASCSCSASTHCWNIRCGMHTSSRPPH